MDGFVYGDAMAFVTHDGGEHWVDAGLGLGYLRSIVGSGNVAWAVIVPCGPRSDTPCTRVTAPTVQRSVDAGRTWSPLHSLRPETGYGWPQAVAFGGGGLLVSGWTSADISTDGGTTWTRIETPCTGDDVSASQVATVDGREIWELCDGFRLPPIPNPGNLPATFYVKGLFVSENGGASWSAKPLEAQVFSPDNDPRWLFVSAKGTAWIADVFNPTFVTHDSADTWKQAGPRHRSDCPNGVLSLRFSDANRAWAIEIGCPLWTLWASHDGGETWALLINQPVAS